MRREIKKYYQSTYVRYAAMLCLVMAVFFGSYSDIYAIETPDAVDDSIILIEGATDVIITWSTNDSLVDFAALDSFDVTSVNGGAVIDNGNGSFNYTPPVGFVGTDSFTYTICDNDIPEPTCDTAQSSIEIIAKNQCETGFYQTTSGIIKTLDTSSSPAGYVPLSTSIDNFNAAGYNPMDGLIYGYAKDDQTVKSFDPATGIFTTVFSHTENDPITGDFDASGNLYYTLPVPGAPFESTMWILDTTVAPPVRTSMPVVDLSGNPTIVPTADFAFFPPLGKFYGVHTGGTGVVEFDPATGIIMIYSFPVGDTIIGDDVDPVSGNPKGFGAAWVTGGTTLYSFSNMTGNIFRIDLSGIANGLVSSVFTSESEPNINNDGMSCPQAADPFIESTVDYGDAPDSYSTLIVNQGAGALYSQSYRIGNYVDTDDDGMPSVGANGEDVDGGADDDGVFIEGVLIQNQTVVMGKKINVTISVPAGNGYVNGWIDWNSNGVFDTSEHIIIDAQPLGGVITQSITVPVGITPGDTYARFRLAARSGASHSEVYSLGEVEDYLLKIEEPTSKLSVQKNADASELSSPIEEGQFVQYSIAIQNTGNQDISNVTVIDTLFELEYTDGDITTECTFPVDAITGLAVGEIATCEIAYALSDADATNENGELLNTVVVSGIDSDGEAVEGQGDVIVVFPVTTTSGGSGRPRSTSRPDVVVNVPEPINRNIPTIEIPIIQPAPVLAKTGQGVGLVTVLLVAMATLVGSIRFHWANEQFVHNRRFRNRP